MNTILKITAVLFLLITSFTTYAQSSKDRDKVEVQVDGLGCPFCAYGLEKKFKEFKGIKDIAIDIETGDFSFTYPSDKKIDLQKVMDQVKKAGYTPNLTKITRSNGVTLTNATKLKKQTIEMEAKSFFVNGKCGMCKARIEKALNSMDGVATASWDQESKTVKVFHDPATTSLEDMEKQLALEGHDTKGATASDEDYDSLPPCCNYKRIK